MRLRDHRPWLLTLVLALAVATAFLVNPLTPSAQATVPPLDPCRLPVVEHACDVVGNAAGAVAGAAGDLVMRGVTTWVTNAAVWVTGKVGGLVEATTSPDLQSAWFEGQYGAMITVAGALAMLMLMLAVIQAVIRQDVWLLLRSAFGYLPMAFILAGVAIAATQLLIWITDDLSATVVGGLGSQSDNLLNQVGDAYKHALDDNTVDAVPLFGVFLAAIVLAIGAFVLWLELIIRDAAIYICVFFLPLTFVGMIWPATSRWARRLVELLAAIVLSKFVIVSILTLATAAITSTGIAEGEGQVFERMLAGAALLVLAAWSPFALLRMIPMMEVAAASVSGQRAAMGKATSSAGIQSPAGYMRQAMHRQSRAQTSPGYSTTAVHARYRTEGQSGSMGAGAARGATTSGDGGQSHATGSGPAPAASSDRPASPSGSGPGPSRGSSAPAGHPQKPIAPPSPGTAHRSANPGDPAPPLPAQEDRDERE